MYVYLYIYYMRLILKPCIHPCPRPTRPQSRSMWLSTIPHPAWQDLGRQSMLRSPGSIFDPATKQKSGHTSKTKGFEVSGQTESDPPPKKNVVIFQSFFWSTTHNSCWNHGFTSHQHLRAEVSTWAAAHFKSTRTAGSLAIDLFDFLWKHVLSKFHST